MIGGLIKSNRMAALAGAGLIASVFAVSPAQAADLGGDCCADLEERVATLEATTARKGNRKVSLTISGWVNTALYIWDDGVESDAYVVHDSGATLSSRLTFAGSAKIDSDWSAGYNVTIEVFNDDNFIGDATTLNTGGINQLTDDTSAVPGILYSYFYIKSERYGAVSLGKQSHATDNVSIVDTSGTLFSGNNLVFEGNTFLLRNGGGGGTKTAATWLTVLPCGTGFDCSGVPLNVIKYESPTISGFTLSASWGENDFADVALRYAGEWSGFKVAAAVGYDETHSSDAGGLGDANLSQLEFGASVMHIATGIFVSGSYSDYEVDPGAAATLDSTSWYVKAGIKQRWNSLGATAIYGEYANYDSKDYTDAFGSTGGAEVDRYGVGIHQWIDAAAMQLYAKWDHIELDAAGSTLDGNELDSFTLGGVIFF